MLTPKAVKSNSNLSVSKTSSYISSNQSNLTPSNSYSSANTKSGEIFSIVKSANFSKSHVTFSNTKSENSQSRNSDESSISSLGSSLFSTHSKENIVNNDNSPSNRNKYYIFVLLGIVIIIGIILVIVSFPTISKYLDFDNLNKNTITASNKQTTTSKTTNLIKTKNKKIT